MNKAPKGDKVVITGGAGFIGSHLVEYWCKKGADVHVIDNLRTGHVSNIEALTEVTYHHGDILDRKLVFSIIEGATYVHHLAAMVSVTESMTNTHECIDINVRGLINVLDAAKKAGVKKLVHSSSCAVYGDSVELPKTEIMLPVPKSPYGITKLDGEYYLQLYSDVHDLSTVSLRYFNVYGPRQDPRSQYAAAIPIFITKGLKGNPITIYGDGEQTRDFVYVADVVAANIIAAGNESVVGTFNVASGCTTSVNALAQIIKDLTGGKSEIIHLPERRGDIKHSSASIQKIENVLGYAPKVGIEKGLHETVLSFRSTNKAHLHKEE